MLQSNRNTSYIWAIPLAFLFPIIQLAIYYIRFGSPSHMSDTALFIESGYYVPMSLLSGIALIYYLKKCYTKVEKNLTILGFVFSFPFAILTSLTSGLLLPPIIGITIFGTIPLIIGIITGNYVASVFVRKRD